MQWSREYFFILKGAEKEEFLKFESLEWFGKTYKIKSMLIATTQNCQVLSNTLFQIN